jgi:hypothetical protein
LSAKTRTNVRIAQASEFGGNPAAVGGPIPLKQHRPAFGRAGLFIESGMEF